jgi:hypothetical protein
MESGETEENNKKSRSKEPVSGFEARSSRKRRSRPISKQFKEEKKLV